MAEKFSLKWNNFHLNVADAFKDLKNESDLFDVTLVCEDEKQISGHKVILSAGSPFFKTVFKKNNKHQHPLIYMKGSKYKILAALLDFIYHGEVEIGQEDLNDFLSTAEDLKIKGLAEGANSESKTNRFNDRYVPKSESQSMIKDEYVQPTYISENHPESFATSFNENQLSVVEETSEFGDHYVSNGFEIDGKIDSMISKVDGIWSCNVCGKRTKGKNDLKKHVETHLDGISLPCAYCGKSYRSKSVLTAHVFQYHRKQ